MVKTISMAGRLFLLWVLTLFIGGCTSVPMPKGSSKGYSTVRFINPKNAIDADKTDRVVTANTMIHEAITAQLEGHNMKVVQQDNADLIVAYLVVVQDNFSTTTINQYFGYRGDSSEILDEVHSRGLSRKQVERFKGGALVIDLIDAKTGKLVYRDYSVRGINSRDADDVRREKINGAAAEALQKFFK